MWYVYVICGKYTYTFRGALRVVVRYACGVSQEVPVRTQVHDLARSAGRGWFRQCAELDLASVTRVEEPGKPAALFAEQCALGELAAEHGLHRCRGGASRCHWSNELWRSTEPGEFLRFTKNCFV